MVHEFLFGPLAGIAGRSSWSSMVMWTVTFAAFPTTSVSVGARDGGNGRWSLLAPAKRHPFVRLCQRDREQPGQQPD